MPRGRRLNGYSRSTIATYFHLPELGVLFDLGMCPAGAAAAPDVFLSHLHIDHAQALPYYAARRNMLQMSPGRIFVPAGTAKGVREWIDAFARLQGPDGGAFDYELHELSPGDEVPVRARSRVRAFATSHRVPSLGFTVIESHEKLRPEFAHLEPREVGARKRAGERVTDTLDTPIFTYLGDTDATPLDAHPEIGQSRVLLAECTFLAPEHVANARETKHLHASDFADRAAMFQNGQVVLTHFSMRYRDDEIGERLDRAFPPELRARVAVLV